MPGRNPSPNLNPTGSPRPKSKKPIVKALLDDFGDFDFLGVGMRGVQQLVPGLGG
jgi:hypothetical protein